MTEKKTLAEWMLASLFQKCHFHRARKSRCPVGHSPRVPAAPVAAAGYAQGEFGRAGACVLPPSLRHVVHGVQPGRESRSARIPTGLMPMRAAAKRPILTSFAKPPPGDAEWLHRRWTGRHRPPTARMARARASSSGRIAHLLCPRRPARALCAHDHDPHDFFARALRSQMAQASSRCSEASRARAAARVAAPFALDPNLATHNLASREPARLGNLFACSRVPCARVFECMIVIEAHV